MKALYGFNIGTFVRYSLVLICGDGKGDTSNSYSRADTLGFLSGSFPDSILGLGLGISPRGASSLFMLWPRFAFVTS